MNPSFEAYWGKYGVDSENNIVKNVIESIFDILYQDTKKTLIDAEKNNPIFDRLEYSKLINILHNLLNKYLDFNTTDTEDIQKKLKTNIKEQIQEIIDNYAKNLKSVVKQQKNEKLKITPIKKELTTVFNSLLKVFFKQSQSNKKIIDDKKETNETEQTSEKNIDKSNIEKFKHELSNQYKKTQIDDNSLVKDIKNTKIFKEYSLKMVKSVLRPSKTIQKISNSISKTTLKKIEKVNKLTKSTPGFGLVKKIIEIRYKKEHQKITNVLAGEISKQEKEQIKNAKKISKHIDGLKSMYLMNLGFVFSTFGKVLKPVGGLIDGAKNVIFHPLATLDKIFSNKWFSNILGQSLKNPATWYGLGFLTAKLWNRIEGPIYKYVLNPVTRFLLKITDIFPSYGKIFSNDSALGKITNKIEKLFKKNDGLNEKFLNLIYNIAELTNFENLSSLKSTLVCMSPVAMTYLKSLANIALSGKLAYFRGAGMIQKLLLLQAYSESSAIGNLFEMDETNGKTIFKLLNSSEDERKYVVDATVKAFSDGNGSMSKSNLLKQKTILQDYDNLTAEFIDLLQLQNIYDGLSKEETVNSITNDEIISFKDKSKLFGDVDTLFNNIVKYFSGGDNFEAIIGRKTQLQILKTFIRARQLKAQELQYMFTTPELLQKRYAHDKSIISSININSLDISKLDDYESKLGKAKIIGNKYTSSERQEAFDELVKEGRKPARHQIPHKNRALSRMSDRDFDSRPGVSKEWREKNKSEYMETMDELFESTQPPTQPSTQPPTQPSNGAVQSQNVELPSNTQSSNRTINNNPSQYSEYKFPPIIIQIPDANQSDIIGENDTEQLGVVYQSIIHEEYIKKYNDKLKMYADMEKIIDDALAVDNIRIGTISLLNNVIILNSDESIQDTYRGVKV